MLSTISSAFPLILLAASQASAQSSSLSFYEGVIATGTMGTTNPPEPTASTNINQTSYARLLSLNSVDDWCIFAPPYESTISDSETFEVAWCTQPRNNARVIPDGTITGVSFLKTDMYVQILGYGDLTKLNIPYGDYGGELDPHGAYGSGNPEGGNVTTNVVGEDINIVEWMLYVSYEMFCIRACIQANETYSASAMCWHELDEMGCQFVMPGNYNFNGTFETCDADVAYPPGWYPEVESDGQTSFSSFAQYWTGVVDGVTYTVGDTVTPSSAYSTPSSSNCVTTSTISNGIALASLTSGAVGTVPTSSAGGSGTASRSGSASGATVSASNAASPSFCASSSSHYGGVFFTALMSAVTAVVFLH
ncbi:hypothetical protein K435DRAFT_778378 [Dendrothele bispora CBS 962.96]|uniref:Immunoreactive mannoprotein MP88 n=1 Tax=Dendrothele bispora (strain CBS 962.96) TaxID=1314807 RepID=A0A4S8M3S5_DENBC|nr:hypothetical protein K435DRAFT_778378 [Dendrothele bispora CBS 962.96]